MKYIPKFNITMNPTLATAKQEEIKKQQMKQKMASVVDDIYNLPRNPISDTTSFIVKSTTIDTQKLSDPRFKERNELFILAIDMFSALSNLERADQTLTQLIWQDMKFALKFGFYKRAEQKALELIRVYNESRGRGGEFSRQLITTREELIARHKREEEETKKKGFWGFRKPPPTEDLGVDQEFTK